MVPSGVLGTGEGPDVGENTQGNAAPAGLAVSTDHGATWTLVKPYGITWNPTDHALYIDPKTGRLFYEDYGPIPLVPEFGPGQEGPAHIVWTDDSRTWHHTTIPGLILPENPHFTSARAAANEQSPTGYPSVLYFCANTNVGFTSPAILARNCYRSLDGGTTWARQSTLLNGLVPQHSQCGLSGEVITAVDGYYPEPASDGSLYALMSCGGHTYLTKSTDEAATFPIIQSSAGPLSLPLPVDSALVLGSGPQLRIDTADNMYVVYPVVTGSQITKILAMVSTDRGRSWSPPTNLTPPGIVSILHWAVAVGRPGELALALLDQQSGSSIYNADIVKTTDALAVGEAGHAPILVRARETKRPLLYTNHIAGAGYILGVGQINVPYPFPLGIQPVGPIGAGNDFIGVTIASDGTAWGSFNEDCGPTPTASGCVSTRDQTRGVVLALGTGLPSADQPTPGPIAQGPRAASPPRVKPTELAATGSSPLEPMLAFAFAIAALGLWSFRCARRDVG